MALLDEAFPEHTLPLGKGYELITEPRELTWPDEDKLPELTALKIVMQDFGIAQGWLNTMGWPTLWTKQDNLYQFRVPQRNWDGTNIPRSSLGMPLVYEHVESILPQLTTGVFADDPPFMCKPRPSTSMDTARANNKLLEWELRQANVREETRLGWKSMLIYGTAIWKYGWTSYTKKTRKYKRSKPYIFKPFDPANSALGGTKVPQKGSDKIEPVISEEEINIPSFEHKNLRHVLVDPGARQGNIQHAKYVIDVLYLTCVDLDEMRDWEGYTIPERGKLLSLMFPPEAPVPMNDVETPMLNIANEFRAVPRYMKTTADKLHQPLQVLEYWSKDRVITVLNQTTIIRNEQNPFGKIPFLSQNMTDVLDSFYGIGCASLIGNEQRMQQGVINLFLDDLALSLNGMFTRVRGSNVATQQLRMRPGGIIEMDADKSVGLLPRQPIPIAETQAVLSASDSRAARRTAASESSVQGALPGDKSSITRTATGVNSLSSGTGTRLQAIIEIFATNVFVPLLESFHEMNGLFLTPDQINKILSQELGAAYQGDVLDLINGDYDFDIAAASKLQARASMKQSLPLMYQFFLTEPVMNALADQGKKIDIAEMVKMTFDTSGWPNQQSVIVPMTPQEIQQKQANSPAAQQSAQLQHQAAQEQIKTNAKSQLLEQATTDKAGHDVLRKLIEGNDDKAVGLHDPLGVL